MKGAPGRLAAPLLAAILLASLAHAPHVCAADKPQEKSRELAALKARIERLKREIERAEGTRGDVLDELKQSELAISRINRSLHELDQRLEALSSRLAATRKESERLAGQIDEQRRQLARLLIAQYEQGATDDFKRLLGTGSLSSLARDLDYFGRLAEARHRLVANLDANLARVKALEVATREQSAALAEVKARQKAERRALEETARRHRATLERLEQQIRARRSQVDRLAQDEKRLTRLIERLAARARRPHAPPSKPAPPGGTEFDRLKGSLELPVAGTLTNRFGAPRPETGLPWKGLFIRAAEGSPVKALAAGRVVFADWLRGFGNLLILDHGDGYMSLYGYNQSLYKRVGDRVATGEVVAAAGMSGGGEESGLYFEIRYQGRPVDPLPWIARH